MPHFQKILVFAFCLFAVCVEPVFARTDIAPPPIVAQSLSSTSEDVVMIVHVGDTKHNVTREEYRTWVLHTPYLIHDPSYRTELENRDYCPAHKAPCFLRSTLRQRDHMRKKTIAHVTPQEIEEFLEATAQVLVREPVNARLAVENDTIIVAEPHQNGYTLLPEENVDIVIDAIKNARKDVTLQATPQLAAVRSDNLVELGLTTLIGEGRSNFAGSSADRIHNIQTAASRFDNLLIAPGEIFSFVEHLGAVDGTTGYRKELVIKNNQTIPEYGGGVCQVSTTIFRGAILTGMKITERRNHSYPVKYYEPMGFDATIYLPAPDMKFQNNTDGYILLNTKMEGTELIFRYFGKDDGREVVMDGPHVTSRGTDGSAKTYFTQKVVDASGAVMIDDTFNSSYRSPKDYPRAGDSSIGSSKLTEKPKDWSKKQWKNYQAENGL